jgi:hypothetical protein
MYVIHAKEPRIFHTGLAVVRETRSESEVAASRLSKRVSGNRSEYSGHLARQTTLAGDTPDQPLHGIGDPLAEINPRHAFEKDRRLRSLLATWENHRNDWTPSLHELSKKSLQLHVLPGTNAGLPNKHSRRSCSVAGFESDGIVVGPRGEHPPVQ